MIHLYKVVIVGMTENPGGIETYLLNFLDAIPDNYSVTFLKQSDDVDLAYTSEILRKGASIFSAVGKYKLHTYWHRKKTAKLILQQLDADIVYVNALTSNGSFWVSAARDLDIKAIYHSHNAGQLSSTYFKSLLSRILRPLNRHILADAKRLAVSNEASVFMFGNTVNVEIVNNPIDTSKWRYSTDVRRQYRERLGLSQEQRVIAFVGRLDRQKNPIRMLHIFKEALNRDESLRLIVLGGGVLKDDVVNEITQLDLAPFVKVLGIRRDVNSILSAADCLLLPSLFEGLPFVVLEAQASGLPVVATKGIVPKVANITGRIVEVSLADEDSRWADTLIEILRANNEDRINANEMMGESQYSYNAFKKSIRKILNEVVGAEDD